MPPCILNLLQMSEIRLYLKGNKSREAKRWLKETEEPQKIPDNCRTYIVALSPGVSCLAGVTNWIYLTANLGCWECDKTFPRSPARPWRPGPGETPKRTIHMPHADCGGLLHSVRTRTDARLRTKMGLRQFLVRTKNWER